MVSDDTDACDLGAVVVVEHSEFPHSEVVFRDSTRQCENRCKEHTYH